MPADEPPVPLTRELWSLRDDVRLEDADSALVLHSRAPAVRLGRPDPFVRTALHAMAREPVTLESLAGTHGQADRLRLLAVLHRLGGLVVRSVGDDAGSVPLLSVVAATPGAVLRPAAVPPERLLRLSRFAQLRSADGQAVLESPLSPFRVVCSRPEAAALAGTFAVPVTCRAAVGSFPGPTSTAAACVSYLVATGTLLAAEPDPVGPRFAEDDDPVLRSWEHHDLTFHWRSRRGHHDGEPGAVRRPHETTAGRPQARRPLPPGPRIALPHAPPGPEGTPRMPLREALERRRSLRTHGSRPIALSQLGELLDLALGGRPRPRYPSGGGSYELQAYLSVARCAGLESGIYHYAPAEHVLVPLPDERGLRDSLIAEAKSAAGMPQPPDVLLTLTARFARVSWAYSGLAYALTLKHVGVLQQNLYLLTTAMGLAGCALGSGDTDRSAAAFGLDWREESAVGEFVLGSAPDGTPPDSELGHGR